MEEINIIKEKINQIIDDFYKKDKELLEYQNQYNIISERCISFRLGIYFQKKFSKYNVDCEYNRDMDNVKAIDEKKVYPDIIVHKRKTSNNLIWVEIKKENAMKTQIDKDRKRLKKVTVNNYKYGILIIVSKSKDKVQKEYYKNGEKIL